MRKSLLICMLSMGLVLGTAPVFGENEKSLNKTSIPNDTNTAFRKSLDHTITSKAEPSRIAPVKFRESKSEKSVIKVPVRSKYVGSIKSETDHALDMDKKFLIRFEIDENTAENAFVEKLKSDQWLGSVLLKKVKYQTFEAELTSDQFRQLGSLDEVILISGSDSYATVALDDSTEFTGTRKARNDFNVTGDLNGNPNLYNSGDIVVAVVDTGIDPGHVDLDGGKITAFFDAVNGQANAYDDNGHGTHVASIIAGTGEGNANATGFAPGAALVGVKVCGVSRCDTTDIVQGLEWLVRNMNNVNFDIVNMSIQSYQSLQDNQEIINLINQLNNAGRPVFVAAGNNGDHALNGNTGYNTLSTFARFTPYSVGNVKDPNEGGWGLDQSSSRGTSTGGTTTGPWIVAPGHNILAAQRGTTNGYIEMSGTSMAAPAVAGIHALMLDAYYTSGVNNGGSLSVNVRNLGQPGFDKNYGNGEILAYESIQQAMGQSGNFYNDNRFYSVTQGTATAGLWDIYTVTVPAGRTALNTTLLILDEGNQDLDLYIWAPGTTTADPPITASLNTGDIPQDAISLSFPASGQYTVAVRSLFQAANYILEVSF